MRRPSARRAMPGFIQRTASGHRTTDPRSRLLQERIVILGTPVDETSANDVTARFMYLEHHAPGRDISLYLNSPGGSFHAMSAIYDTLCYVTCDVETVCPGRAEGTAALLPAAGTPGKRAVLPGSRLLLRLPPAEEPVQGRADDPAVRAEEPTRVRSRMEETLVRHTGRTAERVRADVERDTVLDARTALDYGPADRIVPARRSGYPAPDAK
ncbi:ATP-dependent Clp protease proteolytic subunit [Streptomyces sp. NPDC014986]|uniref:ATP-dependent Clp protease proteolytic subunit n=1 Tax=Streptomyces sp. NPDC014986 TaxID=3364934 RepID=UPI0036FDA374